MVINNFLMAGSMNKVSEIEFSSKESCLAVQERSIHTPLYRGYEEHYIDAFCAKK